LYIDIYITLLTDGLSKTEAISMNFSSMKKVRYKERERETERERDR